MITRPGLLMIGAAHRDAGKTAFACAVIRRQAPARRVVALKITRLDAGDADRFGAGDRSDPGWRSFDGPFQIDQEDDPAGQRDTSRLLRAGASAVLWLRVHDAHLAEGVAALLARVPGGEVVVCESSSARLHVVPDLFLVARRADDPSWKPSCAAVADLADRIMVFDGRTWDLDPADVRLDDGRWVLSDRARGDGPR